MYLLIRTWIFVSIEKYFQMSYIYEFCFSSKNLFLFYFIFLSDHTCAVWSVKHVPGPPPVSVVEIWEAATLKGVFCWPCHTPALVGCINRRHWWIWAVIGLRLTLWVVYDLSFVLKWIKKGFDWNLICKNLLVNWCLSSSLQLYHICLTSLYMDFFYWVHCFLHSQ